MTHPTISLKPSYNSVIRGCPGIPDTLPRIECELRVRSNDGRPFRIDKIEVALKGIESLLSGYHSFGSKSKIERVTVFYKKNIKMSEKKIVGIDIPLTIGLPEDIRETNCNSTFGSAMTLLECSVRYNGLDDPQVFAQVVNVDKYTIVPNPQLFASTTKQVYSADRKFVVLFTVLHPCVAVDDHLKLQLEIRPNGRALGEGSSTTSLFGKKFTKLKTVSVGLRECLEVLDGTTGNVDSKENVLQDLVHNYDERITSNGIKLKLDLPVGARSSLFGQFEAGLQEPEILPPLQNGTATTQAGSQAGSQAGPREASRMPSTKLLQNRAHGSFGIPFHYHSSVTTTGGSLFRITHAVAVKIKTTSGKSIYISQPVEVSAWTHAQLRGLDQLISHERETAKYARHFYDNFGGISRKNRGTSGPTVIEYPPLPPVVYPNDHETLRKLDIKYASVGSSPQRVPLIE